MSSYADRRGWAMLGARAKLAELRKEQATAKQTAAIYREANKDIQKRVQTLYDELATQDDQNAWRFKGLKTPATTRSAKDLREKIEAAGLSDYVPERLQRRLSVYEVMELDNWYTITKAGQKSHTAIKEALTEQTKTTGQIWQKAMAAGGGNFVGFDRNQIGYMLGENWYGGNFSSRLWDESQAAWHKVQAEIARALANGQDPQTTRKRIEQILVGAHRAGVKGSGGLSYDVERIMRTEMARAATQADLIKWQDEGVEEVQWNARLEANTCEACADHDGKIFKINEAHEIVPLHPNCRCFLTPYDRVAEEAREDQVRQRQYKDEDGEYQDLRWAPMTEFTKGHKGYDLAAAIMQSPQYFLNKSPATTYEPARTGINYTGDLTTIDGSYDEISQAIVDLTERTVQEAIDKYPEIKTEIKNRYDNKIQFIRNNQGKDAGETQKKIANTPGYIKIMYPYKKGMTGSQMLEELAAQARDQKAKRYWSTGKVNHTINHELGHVLAYNIEWRGGNIETIIKKATGSRKIETAMQKVNAISRYATDSKHEAFAEIFAKSMEQNALDPSRITARFVVALNEERAKYPKQQAPKKRIAIK